MKKGCLYKFFILNFHRPDIVKRLYELNLLDSFGVNILIFLVHLHIGDSHFPFFAGIGSTPYAEQNFCCRDRTQCLQQEA